MPTPNENHVRQVLAKNGRDQKLLAALRHGWDRRKSYPNHARWRRKTTRAHAVWEEAVDRFIELLAGDRGVHVEAHHDTVSFIFEDTVLLRLKKADTTLRSRNVQTALSDLFDVHEVDLFGFQGHQRVEAVYVLNRFETQIFWAGIVATDHGNHLWHFELTEAVADNVKPLPLPPRKTTATLAKLRKPPAGTDDKKKDEGKGQGE